MMHTLLIIALASLLLSLLSWGAVRLLGVRPHGQSALLVVATLSLLCLPVAVYEAYGLRQKSAEEVNVGSSTSHETVHQITDELVGAEVFHVMAPGSLHENGAIESSSAALGGPTPLVAEDPPLLVAGHPALVNTETQLEPLLSAFQAKQVEASQSSYEIHIPVAVDQALPYVSLIWLIGAVVCGLRFTVQCVRFRKQISYHRPLRHAGLLDHAHRVAEDMGIRRLPKMMCSDELSPYCYGVFNRRLHFPKSLIEGSDQDEISMILHHELQHVRQHDLALLMLQIPVRVFYWWNPLVTGLMKHLDYVRETLCDRAAAEYSPQRYARLLLKFASSPTPSNQTVMAMASSAAMMKARIKNIYGPKKKDFKSTGLVCATAVSGLTALLLCNVEIVSAAPESAEPDESTEGVESNKSNKPKQTKPDVKVDLDDPTIFYPHYLKKLRSFPVHEQLRYAAALPISNNPALIHNIEKQTLESSLHDGLASGLGVKHPYVLGLQQRLEIYDNEYAQTALKITISILENKDKKPPSLIILKLFVQRREVSRLRAEGLGFMHPEIIQREQSIQSLEQKIDDWNQNEKKQELEAPAE